MRTRWPMILILVPLGGVLLYVALPALSQLPVVRRWVTSRLERATSWQIRLASLRLNHDLSLTLSSLSVAVPEQPPFLTVDRLSIAPHLLGVFWGRVLRIRIEGPHLYMAELPERSSTGGGALVVPLEQAEVIGGFVHIPAREPGSAIGPLTLVVGSAQGTPGRLVLSGEGALPEEAGSLAWSAEIGSALEESHGSLHLEAASLPALARPWIDLALPAAVNPNAASLHLDWRGLSGARIAADLTVAAQMPLSDGPLHLTGSGEIDLRESRARVRLGGTDLAWRSAAAARAVGGVELGVELAAHYHARDGLRADFAVAVPAGELLWDRFYVDLRAHPLALRGRLDATATRVALSGGTLSIGGLGAVTGGGSYDVARRRERWRAELDLPGLAAAYRVAVSEPFQAEYPLLGRVEISGRAGARLEQERLPSGVYRRTGFVDLSSVAVTTSAPRVAVDTLAAHVPFDLVEAVAGPQAVQIGFVRVRGLRVGDSAVGDIDLPLRAESNLIALAEPVRVAVLGGALDIAHLRLAALVDAEPQAQLGLAVNDVDLAELTRALGWPTLTGTVVGTMPELTVDRRHIQSEGEIRIEAFGGTARLQKLRIDEPLSPVPTLHLDADMADISLAQLTGAFELGRISGVAAGSVRGLEIANGEPSRFEAWMETVPRRGVAQRISVDAIRQLSILGGSGGDPISLGVLGFFDEYRYAKMGFRCRLENDRFILRGVEEIDGGEYLVVGTILPPRVNVISHTRVISFSEMVERLRRVFAVTEAPPPQADATPTPSMHS